MAYVFRGGIYFRGDENTESLAVVDRTPQKTLTLTSDDVVGDVPRVGEHVLRGQVVLLEGPDELPLHSPVSGTVSDVVRDGASARVTIQSDGEDELSPDIRKMNKKLADCSSDEIIERIHSAGIRGLDGKPTSKRLTDAIGRVENCIINCAGREPYVSRDIAVTSSSPAAVVNGLKIFLRALGIRRGIIAVPDVYSDTIKKLSALTRGSGIISVMAVSSKYPEGNERRLVYAVTGRELRPHADSASVGCVVFNVSECASVFAAFVSGMPQTSAVVSVGGDCVGGYANVEADIGTGFSELADAVGGLRSEPYIVIDGGPLSGTRSGVDGVVSKTTRAVLFFSEKASSGESPHPVCIRCGKCVEMCPEGLMPNYIYSYLRDGKTARAIESGALDCVSCGICSYICPGKAPVAELIADFKKNCAEGGGEDEEAADDKR